MKILCIENHEKARVASDDTAARAWAAILRLAADLQAADPTLTEDEAMKRARAARPRATG